MQADRLLKELLISRTNLYTKFKTVSRVDKTGEFAGTVDIVELTATDISVVRQLREAISVFVQNAPTAYVIEELSAMYVSMARRAEQESDKKTLLKVYAVDLNEYPEDVIRDACRTLRRESKFFPTLSELIRECEERFAFRRNVATEINALLAGRKPLLPKPDPRDKMSYKELPREKWMQSHWDSYITDAEQMLAFAEKNPIADKTGWEAEVAKRKAALPPEFGGTATPPIDAATPTAIKDENELAGSL